MLPLPQDLTPVAIDPQDLKLRAKLAAIQHEERALCQRPPASALDRHKLPLGSTFATHEELDEREAQYITRLVEIFKEGMTDFTTVSAVLRSFGFAARRHLKRRAGTRDP